MSNEGTEWHDPFPALGDAGQGYLLWASSTRQMSSVIGLNTNIPKRI